MQLLTKLSIIISHDDVDGVPVHRLDIQGHPQVAVDGMTVASLAILGYNVVKLYSHLVSLLYSRLLLSYSWYSGGIISTSNMSMKCVSILNKPKILDIQYIPGV